MNIPGIEGYELFGATAQQAASGGLSLSPSGILNNIMDIALRELRGFSKTAAMILILALLSSVISVFNSSFGEGASSRAAFFAFFSVISGLALSCFQTALGYCTAVIGEMTGFMNKFTPVLVLTIFACGKPASGAAFEPVLSAAVYIVSVVVEKCLVPLMTFSAVLSVAGNIGGGAGISGFTKIVRSTAKWLMAFIITLFTGINSVYGFSAASLDAVSAKTIKFAMGSLVPVVGGFLSESLDTVTTSATLIKNAAGVSGIVVMCAICVVPIIKIGAMQLMLRLCAAITEPVADKRISGMLWSMSEALTSVFAAAVLTAVLFALNICIILRATG